MSISISPFEFAGVVPLSQKGTHPAAKLQSRTPFTPDLVRRVDLGHGIRVGSREWSITVCDAIIDLLATLFDVDSKLLRASSRATQDIARIRQIGMYVAHVTCGMRMTEIGIGFSRDKSTILHGCHLIEDMRDDPGFDAVISRVEQIVSAAFMIAGSCANSGRVD